MFWSKRRHSSISRSFRWSMSRIWQPCRLAPAKSPKLLSPPDWDPSCCGHSSGLMRSQSLLTAVQQSRWHHGGLELCPAGRWRSRQRQNEWLAAGVSTACLGNTTHWSWCPRIKENKVRVPKWRRANRHHYRLGKCRTFTQKPIGWGLFFPGSGVQAIILETQICDSALKKWKSLTQNRNDRFLWNFASLWPK